MERLRIALAYEGPEGEAFDVPDRDSAGTFMPEAGDARGERALFAHAYEDPIGALRPRDAAEAAGASLLLVDDNTRATRVHEILPHVAREL